MSDILTTSLLDIERVARIAGDEGLGSQLEVLKTELQTTQNSVSTEVLHRSEGDLVIQRILEGYIQDLLESKSEEFNRYLEFQNDQNLNYVEVKNFVTGIRYAIAEEIRTLSQELISNLQANDVRFNKLSDDVSRYLTILSDITLDSNQITLDNGELRAGAWTILSQARQWDLEILAKLRGLESSVGTDIGKAIEELQNQIPSTEETISKAIEELSNAPFIKELSDLLDQSIEKDMEHTQALLDQAYAHAAAMQQLASELRTQAESQAAAMEAYMENEVKARISDVTKEVNARKEAINAISEELLTELSTNKAEIRSEMDGMYTRLKSAEDGLTTEIQLRKDGDSSTLNALNLYKVSNDSALSGITTSLSNNVNKTNANSTAITGLTSRMVNAEGGVDEAKTAAADAMHKANTAVSANSALSERVDALAASITESEDTTVDVIAFNALKAEVNTVKGRITSLTESVTALEGSYSTLNNKVTSQGTAISTLNTKMTSAEGQIQQSADDITLLKADITSINGSLTDKVGSQAFNNLSTSVNTLETGFQTQSASITDLRGSLETTQTNVSNAATAAQDAMTAAGSKGKVFFQTSAPAATERLSQNLWIDTTGGNNTPKRWNGAAWVAVTDKVATDALSAANAATVLANTKADTSAFNELNQKVNVMDGVVSANTNSITSLTSEINRVEGKVNTKLDSSAIVNYYTKQEADDKALSTAAGEVSKYNASLVIGGANLAPKSDTAYGWSGHEGASLTTTTGITNSTLKTKKGISLVSKGGTNLIKIVKTIGGLEFDSLVVMRARIQNKGTTAARVRENGIESKTVTSSMFLAAGEYYDFVWAGKTRPSHDFIQLIVESLSVGDSIAIEVADLKVEYGTKPTAWTPSAEDIQERLDANASAIQTTNSEVTKVDDKTKVNANSIIGLNSRLGTVEGKVSTKAEASALNNYYTKTEADKNATTVAAGEVSKYDASLVIGGKNFIKNGAFKDDLRSWNKFGTIVDLSFPVINSKKYIRVVNTVTGVNFKGISQPISGAEFSGGDDVVVSFEAYTDLDTPQSIYTLLHQVGNGNNDPQPGKLFALSKKAQRYEFTFKVTDTKVVNGFNLMLFTTPLQAADIYITEVMIQKGSKATAYVSSEFDTQDSISANASAISTTNSEVVRVDGRVTATNTEITALKGSLTTTNNNIALKADQSALTALTGRVDATENGLTSTNSNITSLKSAIAGTAESITANGSQATLDVINLPAANALLVASTGSMTGSVIKLKGQAHVGVTNSKMLIDPTKLYRLRMRYRRTAGTTNYLYVAIINYNATGDRTLTQSNGLNPAGTLINSTNYPISYELPAINLWREVIYYFKGKSTGASTGTGTLTDPRTFPALAATVDIGVLANYNKGNDLTQEYEFDYLIFEDAADAVNADAITSTNTEVSRINGEVKGHTTQLSNLTASVAGKADTSALNALTVRVADEENKSSSQAQSITDLKASVKDTLDTVTIKDVRSTNELPIFYWTNYRSRRVNEFKYQTAIGVSSFFSDTYCNLETLVYWSDSSGGPIIQTATSGSDPSLYVQRQSSGSGANAVWTAWKQPIKDLRDALGGKASAQAVSSLEATVNGMSTHAAQLTTLRTDVNNNTNALSIQAKVVNGVKASYMVKMETNGVVGGFGMIQESGAMGTVTTSFGVNANNFFIGAPSGGKKPFIVTTSTQTINGVSYPAGTWIDVALIANATIGTAKIADLAVTAAKIANATITNAEIANATITGAKIANATIGTAQIANLAVTAAKIANATITAAEIANATITGAKIANATIGSAQISDAAITNAKIGNLEVDTIKIKNNAVTVGVSANNVKSLSIATAGGKVLVTIGIEAYIVGVYQSGTTFTLKRNGTTINTWKLRPTGSELGGMDLNYIFSMCSSLPPFTDSPPAGTNTYTLETGIWTASSINASISLLETKK